MKTKLQHTSTPWKLRTGKFNLSMDIYDSKDEVIVSTEHFNTVSKEDAELIVRAVNSHRELLEAAKCMEDTLTQDGLADRVPYSIAKLRKAIAKASGEIK